MSQHRPEVADVFRHHQQEFLHRWGHTLCYRQVRALRDIGACRTAALGAHRTRCDECAQEALLYNSCLNRHCPKCGSAARNHWLEAHDAELLPVPYSHVVFTLPHELIPLALQNPKVVYNILFRAAAETLLQIAADPRHLGARLGFLAVLHTWNQKLLAHPHLHCLVPAGGIANDGTRWVPCRHVRFFLPEKVLAAKFRGKFLHMLGSAFRRGKLTFSGSIAHLCMRPAFDRFRWQLKQKDWIVHCRKPFSGPQHVIRYLAHYTHRVAIANGRIIRFEDNKVSFRWRDSAHSNKQKVLTIDAVEFMHRFLLHVLPRGFVKIRHFGFLSNRERAASLQLCSVLLGSAESATAPIPSRAVHQKRMRCRHCQRGTVSIVERISAAALRFFSTSMAPDSS